MSDQQPDRNSDENEVDIPTFLDRDGSIGILLELDASEGLINKDLQDRVHVATTTLSNRLTEAEQLKLIETVSNPEDHGNATRYRLTKRGAALRRRLKSRQVHRIYSTFVSRQENLESEKEKLATWATEEGIDDDQWPPEHDRDDDRPDT